MKAGLPYLTLVIGLVGLLIEPVFCKTVGLALALAGMYWISQCDLRRQIDDQWDKLYGCIPQKTVAPEYFRQIGMNGNQRETVLACGLPRPKVWKIAVYSMVSAIGRSW
jgi:hypothetical protein